MNAPFDQTPARNGAGSLARRQAPGSARPYRRLIALLAVGAMTIAGSVLGTPAFADPFPASTIGVGVTPTGVAFSPDGSKAYVANTGSKSVSVIATGTSTLTGTIAVGAGPCGVAFSPDGTQAYVTNIDEGTVSVIAVATGTVTGTITVGARPEAVAFSRDGTKAYVANNADATVSIIAVATGTAAGTVTSTVAVGDHPDAVAVSFDDAKVYVTNYVSNSVSVIAVATGTVTGTITVGSAPAGVAFSPDGTKAYVTNGDSNTVSVIAVGTGTDAVTATIATGSRPQGVAFSPDGKTAYATDYTGFAVSVIDVGTNTVRSTMSFFGYLYSVAVSPDGTKVYATSIGQSAVVVILPLASMVMSPGSESVSLGATIAFSARGFDVHSNDLGAVYPSFTATSGSSGMGGSTLTFNRAGTWVVTARLANVTTTSTIVVPQASTSLVAGVANASITYGNTQSLTFAGLPTGATGSVQFSSGSRSLCRTANINAAHSCAVGGLTPGTYPVTANYSGDDNYLSSNASTSFTVSRATTALTAAAVSSSVSYGTTDSLVFGGLPAGATGSVSFTNSDGSPLCTVADMSATASCVTSAALAAGTYAVTATYSGDGNFQGSTATTAFTVLMTAIQSASRLGAAGAFSVLAGAAVTASADNIWGDLGAGAAVTAAATTVGGALQSTGGSAAGLADLAKAYTALKALPPTSALSGDDLGGQRITPGVYHRIAALAMTTPVTFDAQGDPNAIFVIQSDAALNTTAGSTMILTGGAQASNIFWVTTGAATLGGASVFFGNILANAAVTVGAGSTIHGRVLSVTAAVTLPATTITR